MSTQSGELPEWQKHKTPRDVAAYMRGEGSGVGRKYETHRDVWNASEAVVQTGLLHLILDELKRLSSDSSQMERHREWLNFWHPRVSAAIDEHKEQRARLVRMLGPEDVLGDDLFNSFDVHMSSQMFRADWESHDGAYYRLTQKIKRMKSVRRPADVCNLDGIGKKKAQKILEKLKAKSV